MLDSTASRCEDYHTALEKIAGMFSESHTGATLLDARYGYYDILKTARDALAAAIGSKP
jgi:hypothetical protein